MAVESTLVAVGVGGRGVVAGTEAEVGVGGWGVAVGWGVRVGVDPDAGVGEPPSSPHAAKMIDRSAPN